MTLKHNTLHFTSAPHDGVDWEGDAASLCWRAFQNNTDLQIVRVRVLRSEHAHLIKLQLQNLLRLVSKKKIVLIFELQSEGWK